MKKAILTALLTATFAFLGISLGQEKDPPKIIPEKFHNYQTIGKCSEKKETLFIGQKFQRRPCDIDGDGFADVLELYPLIKTNQTKLII